MTPGMGMGAKHGTTCWHLLTTAHLLRVSLPSCFLTCLKTLRLSRRDMH